MMDFKIILNFTYFACVYDPANKVLLFILHNSSILFILMCFIHILYNFTKAMSNGLISHVSSNVLLYSILECVNRFGAL